MNVFTDYIVIKLKTSNRKNNEKILRCLQIKQYFFHVTDGSERRNHNKN